MSRYLIPAGSFIGICLMGLAIGSAYGFVWGTLDAGICALLTFLVATVVFTSIATFPRD